MITLPITDAQELHSDLLQSASGTLASEKENADSYRNAARALRKCTGGQDYVELTPELADIATRFGFLG